MGGYTKEGFKSRGKYVIDNNAFVFSITKKKIYKVKNGRDAIYDGLNCGPCFASSNYYIININNKMLDDNSNTCPAKESHYEGITKDYELNNGEQYFRIQEIEVYQILFN